MVQSFLGLGQEVVPNWELPGVSLKEGWNSREHLNQFDRCFFFGHDLIRLKQFNSL